MSELTDGGGPVVRIAAPDLQQARRVRARIRTGGREVAVILDVTVAVAGDFRSAREQAGATFARADAETVQYAGTVEGLTGLVSDIASAGVADGVTLIPASPGQDVGNLGRDVLDRLARRVQPRAS